jgi:hypothetical protein
MKQLGIIFLAAGFCFAIVAFYRLGMGPTYRLGMGPANDISILLGLSEIKTRFIFGIAAIISFLISGIIGIIGNSLPPKPPQ